MTGKEVLPEKHLLEKAAALKRLEYSPLGKELKKQISVAEKQYQKFGNSFEENETRNKISHGKSNLVYDNF